MKLELSECFKDPFNLYQQWAGMKLNLLPIWLPNPPKRSSSASSYEASVINSYPAGQHGHHLLENIFKCIFLNEKFCILVQISLKIVLKVSVDNNPPLV